MNYRKGFKYQLEEEYVAYTGIIGYEVETTWIRLEEDGKLILRYGYAWNGSNFVWDTKSSQQASAEHDAFYKLLRLLLIPMKVRKDVDKRYGRKCKMDGMWEWRAKLRARTLKKVGSSGALQSRRQKIYYAP